MHQLKNKSIGIWGFGITGKSALKYLNSNGYQCGIFDQRELSSEELTYLFAHNGILADKNNLKYFLKEFEYIFVSPGIDINPYKDQALFLNELDLFTPRWGKKLITVTGSVGKTSTTTLIAHMLQEQMPTLVGGNIGIPMLSLLDSQENTACAVLELSSWQLEHAHPFSPDIAVWTNLYPNHLDRHKTFDSYFKAKARMLLHQLPHQTTILPLSLYDRIKPLNLKSKKIWFQDNLYKETPTATECEKILMLNGSDLIVNSCEKTYSIGNIKDLPEGTYTSNLLCVAAVMHVLDIPLHGHLQQSFSIEHRLEKVLEIDGIGFYNDSKSTVPESTLAAIDRLHNKKIVLILGGLSKGVDRKTLIAQLPAHVKQIVSFGKEAAELSSFAQTYGFATQSFALLEPAFTYALAQLNPGDVLLFSPAGSSLDLYTGYEIRGKHFKQLVSNYVMSSSESLT